MSELARSRLAECIGNAFQQCFSADERVKDGSAALETSTDNLRTIYEQRLIAAADFTVPYFAAGLLDGDQVVVDSWTAAEIGRRVDGSKYSLGTASIGCRLAIAMAYAADEIREPLVGEMEREWSSWLMYCTEVYSPELRAVVPRLAEVRRGMVEYLAKPRRRIERATPDGEKVVSQVPALGNDDRGLELLLEGAGVVASKADKFRRLGRIFPELLTLSQSIWPAYFMLDPEAVLRFDPILWPFGAESLEDLTHILSAIERIAGDLVVRTDEDDMQVRPIAY